MPKRKPKASQDSMAGAQLEDLTVAQLKGALQKAGIKPVGRKADLIQLLQNMQLVSDPLFPTRTPSEVISSPVLDHKDNENIVLMPAKRQRQSASTCTATLKYELPTLQSPETATLQNVKLFLSSLESSVQLNLGVFKQENVENVPIALAEPLFASIFQALNSFSGQLQCFQEELQLQVLRQNTQQTSAIPCSPKQTGETSLVSTVSSCDADMNFTKIKPPLGESRHSVAPAINRRQSTANLQTARPMIKSSNENTGILTSPISTSRRKSGLKWSIYL